MPCSKRLLLTGATGLIGKELAEPLLSRGFDVHAITIDDQNPENGYHWIKGSLFDEAFVERTLRAVRPDYLLNLAWCTTGDYLTSGLNERFLMAGISLARAFRAVGGRRAVFAGTCFEYKFKTDPIAESDELDVEKNAYTHCKDALRVSASEIFARAGVDFSFGRIFYAFGRNENKTRLTGLVLDKLSRGERIQIRTSSLRKDYIYAKDVAAAFAAILDSSVSGPVNICTGRAISIRDFVTAIASRLGRLDLVDFDDIPSNQPPIIVGDNRILREQVGFTPRYDVPSAVADLMEI